ncbi:alpha/beta hydrolase [Patescibacteria group bacterium]|nr:alpha/beta hydrolase [Patescibacteria group bacterium]
MKKFLALICIFFVLPLGGCKKDFHSPKQGVVKDFGDGILVEKDVRYGDPNVGGDQHLTTFDVYYREEYKNAPVIIQVHGGSEYVSDKKGYAPNSLEPYINEGFVVMSPNYRWSEAPYGWAPHDLACSIATFRQEAERWGADPDNIILTGASGGAGLTGWLFFRQEYDWLESCPVKDPLPAFKGYIDKSGFAMHVPHPPDIEVEYVEHGTRWVLNEEVIASPEFEWSKERYGENPNSEIDFENITAGNLVMDGMLNHIDPSDGPVMLVYGAADEHWGDVPNGDYPKLFIKLLEDNGIEYKYFNAPNRGHGMKVADVPEVEEAVIEYIHAMANDEPFPF